MAVTSFAYPFGYYSKQGHIAVRDAGFSQAGIVSGQRDRFSDDRWRIPRAQIGPGLTPEDLVALVQRRGGDAKWRNRAKQRLWLFGRRRFAWGPPEAAGVGGADAADVFCRRRDPRCLSCSSERLAAPFADRIGSGQGGHRRHRGRHPGHRLPTPAGRTLPRGLGPGRAGRLSTRARRRPGVGARPPGSGSRRSSPRSVE